MKRKSLFLLTALLSVLIYLSGCSDKMYVNRALTWAENGEKLDTALRSVKHATKLEDTKNWAKTYYAKGYVYQKLYETKEEEFKDVVEDPLIKSFENYKKALEMEGGEKFKGGIDAAMFSLHKYFINEGVNGFNEKNYEAAFENFKYALKVSDMPVFENRIDTAIMFNAAIAAQNMGDWEKAAKYYEKTAKYGYEGSRSYILLNNAYLQMGDTTQAIQALQDGFDNYPSNDQMIASLVNYYLLNSDKPEKALKYLERGIQENPDNPQYYSARAQVYDKINETEKAQENYKKAIELDPDMFMPLYNLGVLYFNQGVDFENKANKTKDEEEYKKLKEKANKKFLESLPLMEKAHQVNPEDMSVMTTLKTLYYRLRTKDEKYLEKYKQIDQKIQKAKEGE